MKGGQRELSEASEEPIQAMKSHRTRIASIEIGRGMAAFAVVLFHANVGSSMAGGPYLPWMGVLEHGVDFFFILSGFIIYTAHADHIGKRGEVFSYLGKRAIRLLPLLWVIVLGYAGLRMLIGDPTDWMTLLRSLFPYPSLDTAAPLVIWTLRHEILFYLIFALVIWHPRLGWPVMLLWISASFVQIAVILTGGKGADGPWSMVFSSFTLDFAMGMALAAVYRQRPFRAGWLPLVAALAVLVIVMWLTQYYGLKRNGLADYVSVTALLWVPVVGAAFVGIVYGLLCIERFVSPNNPLVALGSASYAIYLVHTPAGGAVMRLSHYLPGVEQGILLVILPIVGLGAGFALHYYFERPATNWFRSRFGAKETNRSAKGRIRPVPVANAKGITDTMA